VPKLQTEKGRDHVGIGIAMLTLIESTVSVTTKHSDSAPIASEAAMALVSREEATGAGRLSKPAVPGDRIMVKSFKPRANHPRSQGISQSSRAILRRLAPGKWLNHGKG
jgi:hypothetical protein